MALPFGNERRMNIVTSSTLRASCTLVFALTVWLAVRPTPARAAPVLTPTVDVTVPVWGPGRTMRSAGQVAAAAGPGGWLVPYVAYDDAQTVAMLLAARVDDTGALIDASPPIIASNTTIRGRPAVARGASSWLVVWAEGTGATAVARATRVADDGTVVTPSGFVLPFEAVGDVAVAWDGADFIVAASAAPGVTAGGGAVRVTASDAVSPVTTFAPVRHDPPALAAGAGGVLLAAARPDGRIDVQRLKVGPTGAVILSSADSIDAHVGYDRSVSAAAVDDTYLVVWTNGGDQPTTWAPEGEADVYGAIVDSLGHPTEPAGFAVSKEWFRQETPSVATADGAYWVVWRTFEPSTSWPVCGSLWPEACGQSEVFGSRVTVDGTVQTPNGEALVDSSDEVISPLVVAGPTGPLLAWYGFDVDQISRFDLLARRLDAPSAIGDEAVVTVISMAPDRQRVRAIAGAPFGALAVYTTARGDMGHPDLRASRLDASGQSLDPNGMVLGPIPYNEATLEAKASAVFTGQAWVVAWAEEHRAPTPSDGSSGAIHVRGILPDGTTSAAFALASATPDEPWILSYQFGPAVASNGQGALLAFEQRYDDPSYDAGKYVMLDAAGGRLPVPMGSMGLTALGWSEVAVASDGDGYLLVLAQYGEWLAARRIAADGSPVGPAATVIGVKTFAGPFAPHAAAAPWGWLVTWDDGDFKPETPTTLHIARLAPDGTLLDVDANWPLPTTNGAPATLSSFGTQAPLVAWVDLATSAARAAWFAPDGTLQESPFDVSEAEVPNEVVVVAATGPSSWAVLSTREASYGDDPPVAAYRAGVRVTPPPDAVGDAGDAEFGSDVAEFEPDTVEPDTVEVDTVEVDTVEVDTVEVDTVEVDTVDSDTSESDAAVAEPEDVSPVSNVNDDTAGTAVADTATVGDDLHSPDAGSADQDGPPFDAAPAAPPGDAWSADRSRADDAGCSAVSQAGASSAAWPATMVLLLVLRRRRVAALVRS